MIIFTAIRAVREVVAEAFLLRRKLRKRYPGVAGCQ
jgi:hypothetical protein